MIPNNHKPNQKNDRFEKPVSEFTDKVVQIKRVSKKTKGGNQIHFTALVVSGDKKSRVGVGLGKAKSVADAIQKGIKKAQKSLITIPIIDGTISGSMLRPGKTGSGIIAGGPVRSVVEAAGIKDIASKIIGSKNKSINVWATLKALSSLQK